MRFYCCDTMYDKQKTFRDLDFFRTKGGYNFCPYCGQKLSING